MTPKGNRHSMNRNDLIDKLINMRVKEGKTRLDIFAYLCKDLEYDDKTAYRYMADAREETDRRAVQNFGEDLKEDIERWEADRDAAILRGDHKLAKECLVEIGKLKGHYVAREDITSGGKELTQITLIRATKPKSNDDEFFDSID